MSAHIDAIKRIARICSELGSDELRVLEKAAERLAMGRKQYGQLDLPSDRRDWRKEAHDEAIDMAMYLAIATLKRE